MKLLALDTSSIACSVALGLGDQVWRRHEEQPREHTRLLVPMIRSVLDEADARLEDLDAIVLGNGPGSFIGMRIAASVAQGLAHGAGLGIVPVSSLAAVAAAVLSDQADDRIAVAQDAHMSEVYFGLFERGIDGLPEPMIPERIHDQSAIQELQSATPASTVAAGDGWNRYPMLYECNRQSFISRSEHLYPRATELLRLGKRSLQLHGAQAAAELNPAYLREKVAEVPAPKS